MTGQPGPFPAHSPTMLLELSKGTMQSAMMVTVASGALYAASRVAVFAMARPDGSDPGRRAIAQWIPIGATVIAAILMNQPAIAVAVVFGTSAACLSLVLGMATYLAPLQELPPSRKVWPFVFPASLLTLMAGFSAHLTWYHALMLMALGGSVLAVWLSAPESPDESSEHPPQAGQAMVVMLLVLVMAILGGYLAVKGMEVSSKLNSSQNYRLISPGSLSAIILCPLLVLPTLGTASAVAQRGHPGRALTALVGTVLLNLCALLPIAILLRYIFPAGVHLATFQHFHISWDATHALPYDMASWRIETVLLLILGFALVPVASGRWMIGRLESAMLIIGYAAYIAALAVFGLEVM